MAFESAAYFPEYGAVVHLHGHQRASEKGPRRDRSNGVLPPARKKPSLFDDREPPGLVRITPTRLGCSDHRIRHKETGEPLRDQKVVDRIVDAFREEGADAWFASPTTRFLGNEYDPDDFEQVRDVIDVWFDSGSTHTFVLEEREDQRWPADLYLEGSDQHRGWFHSSLLKPAAREVARLTTAFSHTAS